MTLQLVVILSYLTCQVPIHEQIYNQNVMLELTPMGELWKPQGTTNQDQEETIIIFRGEIKE